MGDRAVFDHANKPMMRLAIALVLAAIGAGQCRAANTLTTATIPPAAEIVDGKGNIWTLNGGQIYQNGVPDTTATGQVLTLRYNNGEFYKQVCYWYKLATTQWPAGNAGWQIMGTVAWKIKHNCPGLQNHPGGY